MKRAVLHVEREGKGSVRECSAAAGLTHSPLFVIAAFFMSPFKDRPHLEIYPALLKKNTVAGVFKKIRLPRPKTCCSVGNPPPNTYKNRCVKIYPC